VCHRRLNLCTPLLDWCTLKLSVLRTPFCCGVYSCAIRLFVYAYALPSWCILYIPLYSVLSCDHVYHMTLYSCSVTVVFRDCSTVIVLLCNLALDFVWLRLHTRFGVSLLVKTLESLGKGRLQCPDNCGYRGLLTGPPPLYILLLTVLFFVVHVCTS